MKETKWRGPSLGPDRQVRTERPLWLFLTEPGLAPLLLRELKFIDAVATKAQAAKLHLRNYDLVILPDAVVKAQQIAPRLALHVMTCPVFGREKLGERQLSQLAQACTKERADGIVSSVAGATFARSEFMPWVRHQLLQRDVRFGEDQAPKRPVWFLAVDEKFYFGFPRFNFHELRSRVAERAGSLPPVIAAAMAFAAKLGKQEVVWDPVVGSGTVLAEVAQFAPDAKLLGTDIDATALSVARKNLAQVRTASLVQADAASAELGPKDLTLTIGNLPFGKQFKSDAGNKALYESILRRSLAHAAAMWRACLLTSDDEALRDAATAIGSLTVTEVAKIDVRGTKATISIIAPAR